MGIFFCFHSRDLYVGKSKWIYRDDIGVQKYILFLIGVIKMRRLIRRKNGLNGTIAVPGDKSISHRAVMFGAIAEGTTKISNFLLGEDCLSTIACFRKLGVMIEQDGNDVIVYGKGLAGLRKRC